MLKQMASGSAVVTALCLGLTSGALANGRTDNRYIGWQGRLDLNGVPLDGPVTIHVGLFTGLNDDASCLTASVLAANCGVFHQEQAFTALRGAFSLKLGPMLDTVVQQPARYLAVAVSQGGAPYVLLNGKQEILPVFSAQAGEDFIVGRTLSVSSDINASGKVVVGGAGPMDVDTRMTVRRADDTTNPAAIFMAANNTQGVAINWQGVTKVGTSANQDLQLSGKGTGQVVVQGTLTQGCKAGFTAVSGGRLCISSAIVGPSRMHSGAGTNAAFNPNDGAIALCRSLKARVCRHAEIHQACSDGVDPYAGMTFTGGGAWFWYGDILGDNAFVAANGSTLASCSQSDNFATPVDGINGSAMFRCCY